MNELSGRVERVEALDASMQADMFALYARYYGGTSKALFLGDLADKQYAVILRDGHGTLQGFSSIKVWEECVDRQSTRLNSITNAPLVCRLLPVKKTRRNSDTARLTTTHY